MTDTTSNPDASEIQIPAAEVTLVCDDPASGQSITFTEVDGRRIITHSYQEDDLVRTLTLSDDEAAEIIAWKNSGRRNSFWNWPGWDAARNRGKNA